MTSVDMSISNDVNHYTTSASMFLNVEKKTYVTDI